MNLGTTIYTWLYGHLVGEDNDKNKKSKGYFINIDEVELALENKNISWF